MPSTSPGLDAPLKTTRSFDRIYPGSPASTLQSFECFEYRQKRYVAYVSGSQLNILIHPNQLVQVVSFDCNLVAVVAEDQTGRLLVAGARDVWVLRPRTEGWTKTWWEKTLELQREDAGDETNRLCWGSDGEALVGGSRMLSLFSTCPASRTSSRPGSRRSEDSVERRQTLWSKEVSSPVLFAEFSPSGSLIASCARYDRLLKIWRRLSYEEGLFDYSYLRHAGSITHVQWRPQSQSSESKRDSGLSSRHDEDAEVLFTIANDAVLHIWRTANTHDADIMSRYATVDLVSSIPQSPGSSSNGQAPPTRFYFILPSDQFHAAIRAAVGFLQRDEVSHSTEHLNVIASQEPDVIVSFDGHGRMSAWGLQNIGHKKRPGTPTTPQVFHIAHAEDLEFRIPAASPAVLKPWIHKSELGLLVHVLGDQNRIHWLEGNMASFFSLSAPASERLTCRCTWLGHTNPILDTHAIGDQLISRSEEEVKIWTLEDENLDVASSFQLPLHTTDLTGVRKDALISISDSKLSLWDESGLELACADQTNLSVSKILATNLDRDDVSGYLLSNNMGVMAQWSAKLLATTSRVLVHPISYADETSVFKFYAALPPDNSELTGLLACTQDGCIYHNPLLEQDGLNENWLKITETGVAKPSNFTGTRDFAAIASSDSIDIVIVELGDGYVEHRQTFDQPIRCIKGLRTRSHHNFLAIAFSDSIQILVQIRYSSQVAVDSAWLSIKHLSLLQVGLHIDCITWLPQGALVASVGNGLYLSSQSVLADDLDLEMRDIMAIDTLSTPNIEYHQLAQTLREPLPVWHPDLLSYIIEHGQTARASDFLTRLARKLKFWSPGDELDPLLGGTSSGESTVPDNSFALSDETISDLGEQLEEKMLPRLCRSEQQKLQYVIHALAFLRDHVNGLDHDALRYLFIWKLQLLRHKKPTSSEGGTDGPTQSSFVPIMDWKEIAFARQSKTQQPLLDILVLYYDNKITWPIARNLGVVAWLSDHEALEQVFEQLAQTAYRSQQPPDPVDASLYFLALHKKPTLVGLWRIATWHKEQRSTMNFLKRDFSQIESRTAAKKNAYALMGKRRFEYGAAFFLLADDPSSAISVLAAQRDDLPLAIAVARLYSGDGSSVLQKLLEDRVIPQAKRDGDRWLLSWCHMVLLQNDDAAESLIKPMEGVRTWHQDDPATTSLYRQVRRTTSDFEYHTILRSARILRRMGFWLPALDLVSQWKFETPPKSTASTKQSHVAASTNGHVKEAELANLQPPPPSVPPSILDGFEQPPVSQPAVPDDKASREAKAAELLKKLRAKQEGQGQKSLPVGNHVKPAPTQFKEPDANSLLDSFGF